MKRRPANVEAEAALHAAILAVPKGEMTRVAEACGMTLTEFLRLRRGRQLDVRASTLVGLARGLKRTADELVGLKPMDPRVLRAAGAAIAERVRKSDSTNDVLRLKFARIAQIAGAAAVGIAPPGSGAARKPKP
jgi:hypothetical protein